MDTQKLKQTALQMVLHGKGILAADESNGSCNKRFALLGIPETEDARRDWREVLLAAPEIEKYLSGVILFDETIRQKTKDGISFTEVLSKKGILIGIKVDKGLVPLAGHVGENITEGLDGLRARLAEYKSMGASFAKWRAAFVVDVEKKLPTDECMRANSDTLAMYALLCQEAGIVPMLEPEVLIDGAHTIQDSEDVTTRAIKILFESMKSYGVFLEGVVLKTSMVVAGLGSGAMRSATDVALRTARTLRAAVPQNVGGVVFLSGGQGSKEVTENLNEIAKLGPYPWGVTYSFSRGIQQPVLDLWKGDSSKTEEARKIFLERLLESSEASLGTYLNK